ncbi:DNA-processing protein DprA [Oleidesulfovibrio sp.]|uniref:DNA-processing protein DprA n=1 Tax=Oleidesulfovibrio sp. TaxID=2909707 RepID=UPI003A840D92
MSFSFRGEPPLKAELPQPSGEHPDAYTLRHMNEMQRKDFWACLALRYSQGVGPRTWKRLLEFYPSPYDAVVSAADWKAAGIPSSRAEYCARGAWRAEARTEWEAAGKAGYKILLWNDPRYPACLKQIPDPPLFLYYLGDASLLSSNMVGVVGARRCSRYGLDVAATISRQLSEKGITIVSGMARGIDRQAHLAALQAIGSTVAVLGNGPDQIYPPENKDVLHALAHQGLVVTEFAPGVPPEGKNFPIRNRIISGLSVGILVVEAAARSGSLITARLALEHGREVFAVPGRITAQTSSGCHELIKQGARTVCSSDDVLLELAVVLRSQVRTKAESFPATDETQGGFLLQQHCGSSEEAFVAGEEHPESIEHVDDFACSSGLVCGCQDSNSNVAKSQNNHAVIDNFEITDEDKVLSVLARSGQLHIDALRRELAWDAGRVSTVLLLLEMAGSVRQAPGMMYSAA